MPRKPELSAMGHLAHKQVLPLSCRRILNYGIYSSTPKIYFRKGTTQPHDKLQWIPAHWSRAKAKGNDQRMRIRKAAWFLSRERHSVEIYHTSISASKQMCGSVGEGLKITLKKPIGEQVLTPYDFYKRLLEVANLANQRPVGRIKNEPNDGSYICPNDLLLGQASSHVPQGPFRETKNLPLRVYFV